MAHAGVLGGRPPPANTANAAAHRGGIAFTGLWPFPDDFCHGCLSALGKHTPQIGITWYTSGQVAVGPWRCRAARLGGRGLSGLGLLRGRIAALAAVIAALLAGGTWFALTRASAQP